MTPAGASRTFPHAMADLDAELLERVARWCAEAGRQAGAAEIRRALAALGWDELLTVRALLADPPPARPLGPHALVDIARGTPPAAAAEREREGRYRREDDGAATEPPAGVQPGAPAPAPRRRSTRREKAPEYVIRRARDRAPVPAAAPPPLPDLSELRRPEGRAALERLVRLHGARRAALAAALAAGWRRGDGATPGEEDLAALLEHHGLHRAFARRERDELLHALRAAGGVRPAAAERLGLDPAGLDLALSRAGVAGEAEQIREERRAELRGRATLAERARLVLAEEARLRDLGLLDEFEGDLRARLPEHLRALRVGGGPVGDALASSLSVTRAAAEGLASRLGLHLGAPATESPRSPRPPPSRPRAGRAPRPAGPRAPARPGPERGGPRGGAGRGPARPPGAAGRPGGGGASGIERPRPGGPPRRGGAPGGRPSATGARGPGRSSGTPGGPRRSGPPRRKGSGGRPPRR